MQKHGLKSITYTQTHTHTQRERERERESERERETFGPLIEGLPYVHGSENFHAHI